MRARAWQVLAVVLAVAGCSPGHRGSTARKGKTSSKVGPGNERVVLRTTAGDVVLSFFPKAAPKTVQQFVRLARAGVFDTTYFYSIAPRFVAQTSWAYDRSAPLTDEQRKLIHKLPLETSPLNHRRGQLAGRRRGPALPDLRLYGLSGRAADRHHASSLWRRLAT